MSTELTAVAQVKADSVNQLPQVVFKLKEYDRVFGIGEIKKYVKIGDAGLTIGGGWKIGDLNGYDNQADLVDLMGSSRTISQQLLQDKGGTSSVQAFAISLIDKNDEITELITPGLILDDILGAAAEVYLGYQGTAWPQDFVRIVSGVIDQIQAGSTIILNVAHSEQKKRVEIFNQIQTETTTELNYRSKVIQGIQYKTRRDVVGTVTVTYTGGGTIGSEVVSVAGNNISVQIESGVSQASDVRKALVRSIDVVELVDIDIQKDQSTLAQITMSSTNLDSDLVINVLTTAGMLLPVPSEGFRTYVKIDDEVIEYTGLTATTITGITRGALDGIDQRAEGAFHDTETEIKTFYRLEGSAIELALKVLMSGGPEYFVDDVQIKSIVEVEGVGPIPNAVWFENLNIQDAWGVTPGDHASIIGDQVLANNVTGAIIQDVVATPYGSYVVLDGVTLLTSLSSTGKMAFASKWNVLPTGAGLELGGDEVDVPRYEEINDTFNSSMFDYDFYIKDTVTGKDFVDTMILFPTGGFTLPRKGKISMGYTSPPLGNSEIKVLDSTNTTKPQSNKLTRSFTKNFYNTVVYRFNEAVTDERFLSGNINVSQDSKNRIPIGNKTLVIDAPGLRPSDKTTTIIKILQDRFSNKYKFGAESITVTSFYGKTFDTDVGDVVVFGDNNLKLPDTKKGSRKFSARLFEVQNKSLTIATGEVKLDLIDSAYSLNDGRYGIISPSSFIVAAGSSSNKIKIRNSYDLALGRIEKSKWTPYIGQKILIHDTNWDFEFQSILLGFSPSDQFLMILKDPVPFTVQDDYLVDIVPYPDNSNTEDAELYKRVFVFTDPTVAVTSGVSTTSFNVASGDASKFVEKAILIVRDKGWDTVSPEVHVVSVAGTLVTVDASLGFTPNNTYEIDLIGFKDGGAPYRYL